jgi:hypothetical protein
MSESRSLKHAHVAEALLCRHLLRGLWRDGRYYKYGLRAAVARQWFRAAHRRATRRRRNQRRHRQLM